MIVAGPLTDVFGARWVWARGRGDRRARAVVGFILARGVRQPAEPEAEESEPSPRPWPSRRTAPSRTSRASEADGPTSIPTDGGTPRLHAESLAAGVRAGDRRALARAITLVENRDPLAYDLVRDLYPETGRAYAVGVTGPPGVGKSTPDRRARRGTSGTRSSTVGVISVDPSSPFTQGALLGDRIRLADHFLDPERLHPLDGHARPPRRARRGDAAGAARARRRRQGPRLPRDGRRRPERGRGDLRSPTPSCSC